MGFKVLCYHEVVKEPCLKGKPIQVADGTVDHLPPALYTLEKDFVAQIEWLRKTKAYFLSLEEVRNIYNGSFECPPNAVLLTFDDAYTSLATIVAPHLREWGIQAVLFVVTGWIFDAAPPERAEVSQCLDWKTLRGLRDVFTFANHTHYGHTRIQTMSRIQTWTADAIQEDLNTCGAYVDAKDVFAYPFGYYNEALMSQVESCGITLAFTTRPGINTPETSPLELNRIIIPQGTPQAVFIEAIKQEDGSTL